MSEYIVCVDDLEESYYKCTDIKPETVFGHRLREQIVRCRDCRHFCEDRRDSSIGWVDVFVCVSEQWSTSSLMPNHKVEPNGFCAWGERRES